MATSSKLFLTFFIFFAFPIEANVFLTQHKALQRAFPEASLIQRKTVFLTKAQVQGIQKKAKSKLESQIITYYIGKSSQGVVGYAFFETSIVRTLPATFMVVLSTQGKVEFVEILAFDEPKDYLPRQKWLGLFRNKGLGRTLWIKRGIHNITGATLTTLAIIHGVRRTLATFEMITKKRD